MRTITVTCDKCGSDVTLERGKEAMIERGRNAFHLVDLCAGCLDDMLKLAETVNDTQGFRQKAAVLLRLPQGASFPQGADATPG
jgi:hypothetical protein